MIFRYPIYHIPMGRNIRDLSTCFLTFHTLSSSFQGILWSIYLTFCLYSLSFSPILIFAFAQIGFTCKYLTTRPYMSISVTDMDLESGSEGAEKRKRTQGEGISLSPFGLATYKMQGGVWVSHNSGRDQERLASLLSVADSWLRQLKVHHHDFNYFVGYRRGWKWLQTRF